MYFIEPESVSHWTPCKFLNIHTLIVEPLESASVAPGSAPRNLFGPAGQAWNSALTVKVYHTVQSHPRVYKNTNINGYL